MIRDSTGLSGTLDTKKFLAAQLAHRNRPDPATGVYSSEVLFGRKIKDLLPFAPGKLKIRPKWHELTGHQEQAMAIRHLTKGS